ncbi:hypothetical protein MMC11_008052 [Xylographa trunciseda]|nr:hypothetical protein [Xylographa trunciseda]
MSSEKNDHDLEAGSDDASYPTSLEKDRDSRLSKESTEHQTSLDFSPRSPTQSTYDAFSPRRKVMITTVLGVCAFLSPIDSTMIVSATPEVASEYNSTGTVINITIFGGVIVTYSSWRSVLYLQTALGGFGVFLTLLFLPETNANPKKLTLSHLSRLAYARRLAKEMNPLRVIGLFRYPNLLCTGLASSSFLWNMYSLLTPIRYVLNPRINLASPIQSAFFYLAPGVGYLLGTFLGGRWADHVVKKYIQKRHGNVFRRTG